MALLQIKLWRHNVPSTVAPEIIAQVVKFLYFIIGSAGDTYDLLNCRQSSVKERRGLRRDRIFSLYSRAKNTGRRDDTLQRARKQLEDGFQVANNIQKVFILHLGW